MKNIEAVNQLVRKWHNAPYKLGVFDCGLLVRDLIIFSGKDDPCPNIPEYSTIQQAAKAVKKLGYKNYIAMIDAHASRIDSNIYNTIEGDIVGLKAVNNWTGLAVRTGVSSLFGFILPLNQDGEVVEGSQYYCRSWDYQFLKDADLLTGDFWRVL